MALLEVKNVVLSVDGSRLLDGVDLELSAGCVHAVVGINGAGKSTLAYTIMGLSDYRQYEGEIRLDGRDLRDLTVDERARLGMTLAWQEPARYEGLTVRRFVSAGAKDPGERAVADVLDSVGLSPLRYLYRAADKGLSGGERKKVELASILAMRPRLVILDEPDSGIDVDSLRRIHEAIGTLRAGGSTVLLITHSMEVLRWAEHAFLMCCGKILDEGGVEKIRRYFGDKCLPCDHRNRPQLNGDA